MSDDLNTLDKKLEIIKEKIVKEIDYLVAKVNITYYEHKKGDDFDRILTLVYSLRSSIERLDRLSKSYSDLRYIKELCEEYLAKDECHKLIKQKLTEYE